MSATDLVLRWAELYTRGLDPAIAVDRRDELRSDLWEHAAHESRPGAAILSRALRGVPADLAWRFEERRRVNALVPRSQRIVQGSVASLVAVAASMMIAFGVVCITRTASYVAKDYIHPWSTTAVWVIALTALAVVAIVVMVRRSTRWLGALLLAASTPLVHFGLYDLLNKSATIAAMVYAPAWSAAIVCLMGALALLFISAAVLWAPTRKAAS